MIYNEENSVYGEVFDKDSSINIHKRNLLF